jgi:2'-5' RNA ligase
MRTFIAIELDTTVKDKLSAIQKELNNTGADIRLVEKNNIHITLRFLGEINENKLSIIKEILDNTAAEETAFEISINSVGAFANLASIRVVWVGIEKCKERLIAIADKLNALLERNNFGKPDKEFLPHITIARTRSSLNKFRLQECIARNTVLDLKQTIRGIVLFKSTLTGKGSIYEKLYEVNFKNNETNTIV